MMLMACATSGIPAGQLLGRERKNGEVEPYSTVWLGKSVWLGSVPPVLGIRDRGCDGRTGIPRWVGAEFLPAIVAPLVSVPDEQGKVDTPDTNERRITSDSLFVFW